MKILLYSALILGLGAAPTLARDAATPPDAPLQIEAARLLTATGVRSAIYIGSGVLAEREAGEPYANFERAGSQLLKGAGITPFIGLIASDAARKFYGQKVIVFARFDGKAKRGVISGIMPATEANLARVKELIAANPTLEIGVTTSKKQYALGESILVKWKIKNVSDAPLSIFTGENATQLDFNFGGRSTSWGDENARKIPLFVRLAPAESWEYERVFKEDFPVGPVEIEYYYEAGDALKVGGTAPDDLFLDRKHDKFAVEIVPATADQHAQLLKQLKNPVWTQQLEAAKLVMQSGNAADIAQLTSFATHPDARLREVAAQAMASQGVFTPALKQLLYQRQQGVAVEPRDLQQRGDSDLALLALWAVKQEALQRQIITPKQVSYDFFPVLSLSDLRIGDILAARLQSDDPMQGGLSNGVALNILLGLRDSIGNAQDPLPDNLKDKTLAAWKAKRASVEKPFTDAQLQSEMELARQLRYNNYQKGPFYDEVTAILDEGQKRDFLGGAEMDAINKRILALPPAAVPTLLDLMRWRDIQSPPDGAVKLLAASETPDKFERLAQIAYVSNNGNARVAAVGLMADVDFERARPHLEAWLAQTSELNNWNDDAPRLGAALALARRGEKRAVPVLFAADYKRSLAFLGAKEAGAALQKATGLDFKNLQQWRKWWDDEGSEMAWK